MKEKVSQMFKDKLFLVMLVLGLLTIVAAAGVVTIQRGSGQADQKPYLDLPKQGDIVAKESAQAPKTTVASNSKAPSAPVQEAQAQKATQGATARQSLTQGKINQPVAQVGAEKEAATALVLNFNEATKMAWPVRGNVILDYNMDSTIYFPTLDQYKCNPGIVIQSAVSTPVLAPANARVLEVGANEELGNYLVLDMGNDYTAICGQLKEIKALKNEYMKKGQVLGYVAEPTKYYSVEGTNVFFELKHKDKTLDPLDYME